MLSVALYISFKFLKLSIWNDPFSIFRATMPLFEAFLQWVVGFRLLSTITPRSYSRSVSSSDLGTPSCLMLYASLGLRNLRYITLDFEMLNFNNQRHVHGPILGVQTRPFRHTSPRAPPLNVPRELPCGRKMTQIKRSQRYRLKAK